MRTLRPSTQFHPDGASPGDSMVLDPTGTFWTHGIPGGTATEQELGTRLGQASLDANGNLVQTYTTVYGIDATGTAYYDQAGAVAGEEAVLSVGTDGGIYVTKVAP